MDSNHDIVPTLRLNGGVYTRLAADEIERLRVRVAVLERRADTSLIPGAVPTHRCKVCGAYWRKWNVDGETSWNLNSRGCGECCDNVAMGEQIEALSSPAKVGGDERTEALQTRVQPWMMACFGPEISADRIERNHRFFEEATELVQANGMTRSEAHQLVDYTFDRPVGDLHQEVGGVMITLAALCLASGQDMHVAGETELARIWTKVDAIRAKQAAKPKHSPLPEHVPDRAALSADGGEKPQSADDFVLVKRGLVGAAFSAARQGQTSEKIAALLLEAWRQQAASLPSTDDSANTIQALQKALAYWMPKVFDDRSAADAYLLMGYQGEDEASWGEAAQADAERYRWLRDHFDDVYACDNDGELLVQAKAVGLVGDDGEKLDTAIDAAIAANQARKGE